MDWLTIAFAVVIPTRVLSLFADRLAAAEAAGMADLCLGGMTFALRRSRQQDAFGFENADLRARVDLRAVGGWTVAVTPRATYLTTHTIQEALLLSSAVAKGCGEVKAERLRRFDAAADYVGFPLDNVVAHLLTTRAKHTGFIATDKDDDGAQESSSNVRVQEHRNHSLAVTGVTIAPGRPLMARIYNKSEELRLAGRELKRELEHARWREAGWDGEQPVTRVEFQHRGDFLDEVKLRDPHRLSEMLDGIWQADTDWVRLIDPHSHSRRCRCDHDPRWVAVKATTFFHRAAPIKRSREHRGGARPEHVLGSTISLLTGTGGLRSPEELALLCGTDLRTLSEADARDWLHKAVAFMGAKATRAITRALSMRGSAHEQAARLQTKIRASLARFSSEDDGSEAAK